MTSVKLVFGEEIRRCSVGADGQRLRYDVLIKTVRELFPVLRDATITFQWTDDEGDLITITQERELEEAIRVTTGRLLRLIINPVAKEGGEIPLPKSTNNVEHTRVTCDECGLNPIKGIRYKCTVREDYDLCEACEAKHPQPYPMIKITDPSQAPHLLVYGFDDRHHGGRGGRGGCGGRGGGGWWRRGMHPHGPHGPGPMGHMPPPPFGHPRGPPGPPPAHPHPHGPPGAGPGPSHMPPGPFGCPFFSSDSGESTSRYMERKAERLAKKLEKVQAHLKTNIGVPLANAVDALFFNDDASPAPTPAPGASPVPAPTPAAAPSVEDQLLEAAIRESLSINEPDAGRPVHIETAPAAVASLPKPALRYVKDVTFPDNSVVQPGMTFRKIWRVRNDGKHPWPADSCLVSAGGDMMTAHDVREPLPILPPDEETDIAVTLTAPTACGLYTSYFRAQTKEGQHFGHRLWSAVVVAEPEPDWQVLTASSHSPVEATPVPAPIMVVTQAKEVKVVEESKDQDQDADQDEMVEESEHQLTASQLANAVPEPSNQLQSLALLWRREIEILGDMGFHDLEMMLPLLQTHLACPVSLSADKNGTPRVEGMQQVIGSLLSQTFSRDV